MTQNVVGQAIKGIWCQRGELTGAQEFNLRRSQFGGLHTVEARDLCNRQGLNSVCRQRRHSGSWNGSHLRG